jgi:hypothetical protein
MSTIKVATSKRVVVHDLHRVSIHHVGIQGPPGAGGTGAGAAAPTVLAYSATNNYTLASAPADPAAVQFFVNGAKQRHGADYTITGTVIAWVSTDLILSTTDTIEVYT